MSILGNLFKPEKADTSSESSSPRTDFFVACNNHKSFASYWTQIRVNAFAILDQMKPSMKSHYEYLEQPTSRAFTQEEIESEVFATRKAIERFARIFGIRIVCEQAGPNTTPEKIIQRLDLAQENIRNITQEREKYMKLYFDGSESSFAYINTFDARIKDELIACMKETWRSIS